MRILIIEDDERLTHLIKAFFEQRNFHLDVAHDGNVGLEMILGGGYQVAIIDWMLPGRDGLSICRSIRNTKHAVALLILTARTQVEERIAGLDSGADDYLIKPFDLDELLARTRALSRRFISHIASDPMELRCGDIAMDLRSHTARRGSIGLNLTKTEWEVLECLMRHPHQALSREQLLQQVWSYDNHVQVTSVDLYISYVRQKLRVANNLPDPIETVRGIGYRLNVP